jgi:ribosomal subunit interface protein
VEITISGRHFHVRDSLRQYLYSTLDQFKHEYEKLVKAKMVIESTKRGYSASTILHGKYVNITAHSTNTKLHNAIHSAINKANICLIKRMKKLHNHSSHYGRSRERICEKITLD